MDVRRGEGINVPGHGMCYRGDAVFSKRRGIGGEIETIN